MKRKVLFVATVLRCHVLVFHLPYMKWFQEQGYEVHLCCRNDTPDPEVTVPYCDRFIELPFERSPLAKANLAVYRQLKAVIDRFYAKDAAIHEKKHKAVLLCAAAATDDWTMEALECHFKIICRYLHWEDCGKVLAEGCGSVELTKASEYPKKAYELGLGL